MTKSNIKYFTSAVLNLKIVRNYRRSMFCCVAVVCFVFRYAATERD
jgi:hypothetical protein